MPMWIPASFAKMLSLRVIIWPHLPLQKLCHLTWAKTAQVYSILFLIIIMHLPCLSVKSSKPLKSLRLMLMITSLPNGSDLEPARWLHDTVYHFLSRISLTRRSEVRERLDTPTGGEWCVMSQQSHGGKLWVSRMDQDILGGHSNHLYLIKALVNHKYQPCKPYMLHASLRRRDSFVFQKFYCWERKGLAAFVDTCEQ